MLQWPVYKLLRLLIVLLVVSLFTFFLCKNTPGTPATLQMAELKTSSRSQLTAKQLEAIHQAFQQQTSFNKPLFYVGFGTLASPDTLNKACKDKHLPAVERWIADHGNWPAIKDYYQSLLRLEQKAAGSPAAVLITQKLFEPVSLDEAAPLIRQLQAIPASKELSSAATTTLHLLDQVKLQATPFKAYIPALYWYGTDNMYHQYLRNLLTGNFGYSLHKNRPVLELISTGLKWSLITGLSALVLTYLLAIPLGVYTATYPQAWLSRAANILFYIAYALPVYWVATILIIFVASGEYLGWFPAYGTGEIEEGASWVERISITAYHLTLPVICWTYGGVAYLSRQVQASMKEELSKDYIITARAKGLAESSIIWRHAFRNALLPAITLLGVILPGMITGAVVIENIFSIPGMGKLILDALQSRDYPVLYMITLLTALVSVLGLSLSDILGSRLFPTFNLGNKA